MNVEYLFVICLKYFPKVPKLTHSHTHKRWVGKYACRDAVKYLSNGLKLIYTQYTHAHTQAHTPTQTLTHGGGIGWQERRQQQLEAKKRSQVANEHKRSPAWVCIRVCVCVWAFYACVCVCAFTCVEHWVVFYIGAACSFTWLTRSAFSPSPQTALPLSLSPSHTLIASRLLTRWQLELLAQL